MTQAPKDSHIDNNYKHTPKMCQRYARSNSKATNPRKLPKANICQRQPGEIPRLQIQDNYLKQRYAKDMPRVNPRLQIQYKYLKQRYAKEM